MKQHEREFFISVLRSGNKYLKLGNIRLCIKPMTYVQCIESLEEYNDSYDKALLDGLMTEEESLEMMKQTGIWTSFEDKKVEGMQKDMEKLKIEIYNNRAKARIRERIRGFIRQAERSLIELLSTKSSYFSNTCEGIALLDKASWIIKNTTYCNDKKYEFKDFPIEYVISKSREMSLEEVTVRELARSEPWDSLWRMKDKVQVKLFYNDENSEITDDQKNITMWSQLYDNVQESMEAPTKDVIQDDDLLDGWLIVQGKKREKEKLEREFENKTGDKIKDANEVFVMGGSKEENETIEDMNDVNAQNIKRKRSRTLASRGEAQQHHFEDEMLRRRSEINQQYKDKRRM